TTASTPSATAAARFVVSIATDSTSSGHGHPGSHSFAGHITATFHRPLSIISALGSAVGRPHLALPPPVRVATARDAVPALEPGVITSRLNDSRRAPKGCR